MFGTFKQTRQRRNPTSSGSDDEQTAWSRTDGSISKMRPGNQED